MEISTYKTIYLISNFFTIFIIHRFMGAFFSIPIGNKVLSKIAYISYFIITSLAYLLFDIPIVTLLLNLAIVFVISMTYESSIQKRLMYSTYIIVFMMFPELIVGAITGYFHFSVFTEGNYSNSIGIVTTKIISFIEALLLQNYRSSKVNQKVSWSLWVSSILIPISTLIYEIMFVSNDNITKGYVIASVIILFVINITAFYIYDSLSQNYVKQSKLSILETENKLYSKQCEIMQSSTQELQEFRHDMNNQFIALSQLIESKQYDEAEKQLNVLTSLTNAQIIYSTSGNVIIDGLINYKLQSAQNENIKVKTEIAVPNQLQMATTDLVTVIGNLIDNALNALNNVSYENRQLLLKIVFNRQRLIIRISNPFFGEIQCKDGNIISINEDQEHHGYGLKNISKVVNKYKGYMDIDYSENVFTVDIIMYL